VDVDDDDDDDENRSGETGTRMGWRWGWGWRRKGGRSEQVSSDANEEAEKAAVARCPHGAGMYIVPHQMVHNQDHLPQCILTQRGRERVRERHTHTQKYKRKRKYKKKKTYLLNHVERGGGDDGDRPRKREGNMHRQHMHRHCVSLPFFFFLSPPSFACCCSCCCCGYVCVGIGGCVVQVSSVWVCA
jgi:hypothetical protein